MLKLIIQKNILPCTKEEQVIGLYLSFKTNRKILDKDFEQKKEQFSNRSNSLNTQF